MRPRAVQHSKRRLLPAPAVGGAALVALLLVGCGGGDSSDPGAAAARATLDRYCTECHNRAELAGGIDFTALDPHAVAADLPIWETAVRKLRAGEMPPPDEASEPRSPERDAALATLAGWLDTAVGRGYAALPPHPGRVTARRLNRVEYENTVRDLLGVDFAASDEFPPDDSVLGFDNNADVLTVSPTLMQQYLNAAEKIAARAVGGNPLPPNAGFFSRDDRVRQIDANSIELTEILDYDAEYLILVKLAGNRGAADPPVEVVVSVDGEPVKRVTVPVQKSQVNIQGGATQRTDIETRVFLSAARHTIRADFVDDSYVEQLEPRDYRNNNRNIFPEVIQIAGPYPPAADTPAVAKPVLICDPDSGRDCVDAILSRLVERAFRRPVDRIEVERFARIYDEARSFDFTPRQSLQHAIAAVLVSPEFLLRREADPPAGAHAPITDYELASRLSYFLWSSMPDDELFALAARGELDDDDTIRAQVERMLDDPKANALAQHFVGQWLETRSLAAISRDRERFPEWNRELARSMAKETELFFAAVLAGDRPIADFVDGPYTFVDERLARHYGIEGVSGEEFRRVELATPERSGIFTQASVLTVTSYPNRTSVVLRGKYLLDNVLAAPPPGPPADVPGLDEEGVGTKESLRAQMEAHRTNPTCASCHVRMDPLGFGLENYDATGKWRTMDGSFAVDASGELPNGRRFDGPAELKALLAENLHDFAGGLAEKLMTYALGRGPESAYDRKVLRDIVQASAASDYRLRAMITEIALSVPFRERSGPPADRGAALASAE